MQWPNGREKIKSVAGPSPVNAIEAYGVLGAPWVFGLPLFVLKDYQAGGARQEK